MSTRTKIIALGILIAILIALASPVMAQSNPPELQAPLVDLYTMLEGWLLGLANLAYLPFAAPLVFVLVQVTKPLPFIKRLPASYLSVFWSVVLWGIYVVAGQFGFQTQFESFIPAVATIAAAVLGITITPMAAGKLYSEANKNNVALLGYSKSANPTVPNIEAAHK